MGVENNARQDPDIFDAVVAFANSEGGIYT